MHKYVMHKPQQDVLMPKSTNQKTEVYTWYKEATITTQQLQKPKQ